MKQTRKGSQQALTGVFASEVRLVADGGDPLATVTASRIFGIVIGTYGILVQVDLETVNA